MEVWCDLCGWGGPLADPDLFTDIDRIDFCRWCVSDGPVSAGAEMEQGKHLVTFTGADSWTCSCGGSMEQTLERLRTTVRPVVLGAVPSLVRATAHVHSASKEP